MLEFTRWVILNTAGMNKDIVVETDVEITRLYEVWALLSVPAPAKAGNQAG